VPSEVAQPTRWWLVVHYRVQHAPQGYKNILYQIEYFTCNPIPSEYIRTRSHTQSIQNNRAQDVGFLRHAGGLNLYKSCVLCLCYHPVPNYAHLYRSIYHHGYTPRWIADQISSTYFFRVAPPLYYAVALPLFETWEETLICGSTIALFLVKPILVLLTSWVSSLYKLISSTNRWTLRSKCQNRCRCWYKLAHTDKSKSAWILL
jgi:hypothetical protein